MSEYAKVLIRLKKSRWKVALHHQGRITDITYQALDLSGYKDITGRKTEQLFLAGETGGRGRCSLTRRLDGSG
jgi:hypothetical protein